MYSLLIKLNRLSLVNLASILAISLVIVLGSSLIFAETNVLRPEPIGEEQDDESLGWIGPGGEVLPFNSYQEIEDFLRNAEIVSMKEIPTGITLPKKLLLQKDGIEMNAVFRYMDFSKRKWQSSDRVKMNFRDSFLSECAAYELGKILGIDNIPPVVMREIDGQKGTVQAWIEDAMTEEKRLKEKIPPPNKIKWMYQTQVMRVFDSLVYNDDRNLGNYLYDSQWRLWMIDFTRAFQPAPELKDPEKIHYCERDLWDRIQKLTEEEVLTRLKEPGLLTDGQVRTLMKRKDKLIEYIEKMIAEKGQGGVLYSFF